MRKKTKQLLSKRRQFCRTTVKMSDQDYLREVRLPGIPDALPLAIRRALASRCGVSPERIRPDLPAEVLCPLMATSLRARCWESDPDDADLDPLEFMGRVIDDCKRGGCTVQLDDKFVGGIPFFGRRFTRLFQWMFRLPGPYTCVRDWVKATSLFIVRKGEVVQHDAEP